MSQYVDLERMHVFECGGAVVYQMLCGRDLNGTMHNYIYLVVNTHDNTAIVVDGAWDLDAIYRFADALRVKIVGSIYTHSHADHAGGPGVAGCSEIRERGCEIWAGEHDVGTIRKQCGLPDGVLRKLSDGDFVPLGSLALNIIHTPGHTPGSICILLSGVGKLTPRGTPGSGATVGEQILVPVRGGLLISGDTMFVGGSGRTDLWESNDDHMMESFARLGELPLDTIVVPGHNYDPLAYTTIDVEKGGNVIFQRNISRRVKARFLPACCMCSGPCGPRGWLPGQRVEIENAPVENLGGDAVRGNTENTTAVMEAWSDKDNGYVVRFLRGTGAERHVVPPDRLQARGSGGSAKATLTTVVYQVMHGTLLRKEDPVGGGKSASKVASVKRPVGSLVHTTGREWTGQGGTTWVELDPAHEKKYGWLATHGKSFGIDAELLRREQPID